MHLPRIRRTGDGSRRRLRWRSRLTVVSLLATAFIAPATAANAQSGCPTGMQWRFGGYILPDVQAGPIWYASKTTLVSSTPTFLVSEQRLADNSTGSNQVTANWTATIAKTHSIQSTVGVSLSGDKVLSFLTTNVSITIVQTITTSVGVSITAPVPPFSRIIGQYGVAGYDVTFDHIEYMALGPTAPDPNNPDASFCAPFNPANLPTRFTATAPTTIEGWRVIPG